MAITDVNGVFNAIANNSKYIVIDKASISSQTAGRVCSLWRATGLPAQGAIPTTAAVPTSATTGAMVFPNQTDPVKSYLAWSALAAGNAGTAIEIVDRIAHISTGIALNVTTLQTITGFNLATLAPSSDRVGDADYSDVNWWYEVYTAGGATGSNATINVTYHDDTTGNLNVLSVGATIPAGVMLPLEPLIPSGSAGKHIKAVNSIQLSASTGSAGAVGFTVTRPLTVHPTHVANKGEVADWALLGSPIVPNDACLMMLVQPVTTSSGTVRGGVRIAAG